MMPPSDAPPRPSLIGPAWDLYFYDYGEGQRAVIRFDLDAARETSHHGYPYCRRVVVFLPPEYVTQDGLPVREALAWLSEQEQRLLGALNEARVDGRFVGTMTYGGMREFVFQLETDDRFMAVVDRFTSEFPAGKVEVLGKKGWDFFDEKIRPRDEHWQQISDRRVIDELVKAGATPRAPHLLEHTFHGSSDALQFIAAELMNDGFRMLHAGANELTLGKESALDLGEISKLTGALLGFARKLGCSYDGWGTAVAR